MKTLFILLLVVLSGALYFQGKKQQEGFDATQQQMQQQIDDLTKQLAEKTAQVNKSASPPSAVQLRPSSLAPSALASPSPASGIIGSSNGSSALDRPAYHDAGH